ncbi:MAG: glycosyltransferase family 4 protein [Gammaproteobacteria bacterium]
MDVTGKKLVFLVTEDWYFCSHRLELAKAAKAQGHEVIVVTRVQHHADNIIEAGLTLVPVAFSRSLRNPFSDMALLFSLYLICRKHTPDLIHHVALKPVLIGSVVQFAVRLLTGKKSQVVNALTGLGYTFSSNDLKARFVNLLLRPVLKWVLNNRYSHVILQNEDDLQLLTSKSLVDKERVSLIRGSGVDVSLFQPVAEPDGEITVILAARMLRDKGIYEFVDAAKILKQKKPAVRMVLAGGLDDANPSAIPVQQLEAWQSEGVIEWWGKQADMPAVFSQAHIVCLPSYREGLPKVLLEAAACARPLVATDVPGCREIVQDGFNGYLVPARNAESLADAINKLVQDPTARKAMGSNGRQLVEQHFSSDIIIEQTLGLYSRILGGQAE